MSYQTGFSPERFQTGFSGKIFSKFFPHLFSFLPLNRMIITENNPSDIGV